MDMPPMPQKVRKLDSDQLRRIAETSSPIAH
jgi:hypothetical protein